MSTIKHQTQKGPECLLVSLAMVADRPKRDLHMAWEALNYKRASFHTIARLDSELSLKRIVAWNEYTSKPTKANDRRYESIRRRSNEATGLWWGTYKALQAWAGIEFVQGPITLNWTSPDVGHTSKPLPAADLTGRGIVCGMNRGGGAHAVAFENGMIHDPNEDRGFPVSEWDKRYGRGFKSYTVYKLADKR